MNDSLSDRSPADGSLAWQEQCELAAGQLVAHRGRTLPTCEHRGRSLRFRRNPYRRTMPQHTTTNSSAKVHGGMRFIVNEGAPALPQNDWAQRLEQIAAECETRFEAARAELADE